MDLPDLRERAAKIKWVLMDVDGVLTDGRIIYGDGGDELKFFDVQDGMGLTLLRRAGIRTAIVSAKKSRVNRRRAKELAIDSIFQNARDKLSVFEKILKKHRLTPSEVCFIGDDLIDLPALRRAGLAVAVPNAVEEVRAEAHWVTERTGGRGAVREVADFLLKAQGRWDAVTERYRA